MADTIIDRLISFRKHWAGRRFDRRHGIETNLKVSHERLTAMPPEIWAHAGEYSPTNLSLFRRIVRKSGIDPEAFSFVDLGCGKGRVVIAAASYRFRAILGVEADAALAATAKQNVAHTRAGGVIEILHADARTAHLPDGNLFIFMYSPFRGPVFAQVAQRLADLALEPGRAVVIAYSADWEADVLQRTGAFTRIRMRRRMPWARSTVSFFYNEAAIRLLSETKRR